MTTPPKAPLAARFLPDMASIDREAFEALDPDAPPFLEWDWLRLLETSGSAAPESGWRPAHLAVTSGETLIAAAPMYLRWQSQGEFVFDQIWAEVARRMDAPYYPKLVGASPFTPATGYRFLTAPGQDPKRLTRIMLSAMDRLMSMGQVHGASLLFADPALADLAGDFGYHAWRHQAYVWENPGYASFEDYLGELGTNRRKTIHRERRALAEAGFRIRVHAGADIPDRLFAHMHDLYVRTNDKFGPLACRFLTPEFFQGLTGPCRRRIILVAAYHSSRDEPAGMALLVRKDRKLYGRYWGARAFTPFLHFELCYYTPIAYCIAEGITDYDPGMGGEHKARRGFTPTDAVSLHRFADARLDHFFFSHIGQVNDLEGQYIEELRQLMPGHGGT